MTTSASATNGCPDPHEPNPKYPADAPYEVLRWNRWLKPIGYEPEHAGCIPYGIEPGVVWAKPPNILPPFDARLCTNDHTALAWDEVAKRAGSDVDWASIPRLEAVYLATMPWSMVDFPKRLEEWGLHDVAAGTTAPPLVLLGHYEDYPDYVVAYDDFGPLYEQGTAFALTLGVEAIFIHSTACVHHQWFDPRSERDGFPEPGFRVDLWRKGAPAEAGA